MSDDNPISDESFLKKRIVFVDGDFDENLCNKTSKELLYLATQSSEPVTMYISSWGGSVNEFLKIYDIINAAPFDLNTVAMGKATSCGAYLLISGKKRFSYPNAEILLHELSWASGYNKLHDHEDHFVGAKKQQKILTDIVKKRTKIKNPEEFLKKDVYLTPKEAKKLGVIDEIKVRI